MFAFGLNQNMKTNLRLRIQGEGGAIVPPEFWTAKYWNFKQKLLWTCKAKLFVRVGKSRTLSQIIFLASRLPRVMLAAAALVPSTLRLYVCFSSVYRRHPCTQGDLEHHASLSNRLDVELEREKVKRATLRADLEIANNALAAVAPQIKEAEEKILETQEMLDASRAEMKRLSEVHKEAMADLTQKCDESRARDRQLLADTCEEFRRSLAAVRCAFCGAFWKFAECEVAPVVGGKSRSLKITTRFWHNTIPGEDAGFAEKQHELAKVLFSFDRDPQWPEPCLRTDP